MTLPFLPGNTLYTNFCKSNFHKSHFLDTVHGLPLEVGMYKPGIGKEKRSKFQWKKPATSFIPRGEPSFSCNVDLDKKVLCFDAYFQEAVTEMREGSFRKRKVKIYFYLEDDTIQVVEPRMKNSSLNQGTLVRRQKIPRVQPCRKEFYTVEDFNLNKEVCFFGRAYQICDCDPFTKEFYRKLGIILNRPIPLPIVHKEAEMFKEKDGKVERTKNAEQQSALQFFMRDPLVLRFFCYWDDSHSLFGDIHQLVLHYFLSDDTIELIELYPPNSGRDNVPCFLRRTKVPKVMQHMKRLGENTKHSVLNVLSNGEWDYRFILDPAESGRVIENFYRDCDMRIGVSLNIFNKKVTIFDMDEFTKQYYRDKYGIQDFTPADCPMTSEQKEKNTCEDNKGIEEKPCFPEDFKTTLEVKEEYKQCPLRNKFLEKIKAYERKWCYLPPHNGFGGEEDSIGNCLSLHPEQNYTKNLLQFLRNDRKGLDSNILRFRLTLLSAYEPDKERIFIMNFYRTDDTCEIYEIKISGFTGGCFASRQRIPKPCQEKFSTKLTTYYGDKDLLIGNNIVYGGHNFLIVAADEYALTYMEQRPKIFPQSNAKRILNSLTFMVKDVEVKHSLERNREVEKMEYKEFKRILDTNMRQSEKNEGICLKEHDYLTLARKYRVASPYSYDVDCRLRMVREQLRRFNFDDYESLCYQSLHHDKNNTGYLPKNHLLNVFKAHRMPVKMALLEEIIEHMAEGENIKYCKVISLINWKEQPSLVDFKCGESIDCDYMLVNFKDFIDDLINIAYF